MKRKWRYTILGVCVALLILAGFYMQWVRSASGGESSSEGQSETGTSISLSEQGCMIQGTGAAQEEGQILITSPGTYILSGTWEDGQIYVDAGDDAPVTLILQDVTLMNQTEPAIYIEQAKETIVQLAADTENLLQSGTDTGEMTAGEYAGSQAHEDDLLGQMEEATAGGALYTRDDLTITGDGSLTVYGYLHDGIHGNDSLTILGGNITITASGKGIRANEDLIVGGGTLTIPDCYEGLEANQIYIDGGNIAITSRDDGINAYGGQVQMGKGSDGKKTDTMPTLTIQDGTVYINARGDGLDSNGDLTVNGGTLVVDGPVSNQNGALDYGRENGGSCRVNGGTVLAIGASGMAETFGNTSAQASFELELDEMQAGTGIRILDADGKELFSHTAEKSFSNLVFSCSELTEDGQFQVLAGDRSILVTMTSVTTHVTVREGQGPWRSW